MSSPVRISLLLFMTSMFVACDDQPANPPGTVLDTTPADTTEADTADTNQPDTTDTENSTDANIADTGTTDVVPTDTADTDTGDTTPPNDTDDTTQPNDTSTTDTNIVLPTERPPVVTTVSTGLGGWTMTPGRESTKCVVKRLTNTEVLWVSQVRTQLSVGSHHLIVYKSNETEEQTEPFDCTPFIETLRGETYPLMITQIRNETLSFPNGVAFRFEPNQMVRLEAHYLNYFPNEITTDAQVHFDGIAASDVVSEANMLFYGNPDIEIPANQSLTTPKRHLSVLPGTRIFAMTGHTHAYGTNVTIDKARNLNDAGTSVYPPEGESYVWDEPPMALFDPPLTFENGGGFNYTCSWTNTSNRRVTFGESANQEMCFFWAYYYPSQGYRICVSPGSIANGLLEEVCCDNGPVPDLCDMYFGSP